MTPKEIKQGIEIRRLQAEVKRLRAELDAAEAMVEKNQNTITHYINKNNNIWTAVFYEKTLEDVRARLKH